MKKLLLALTLLTSMSSFATDVVTKVVDAEVCKTTTERDFMAPIFAPKTSKVKSSAKLKIQKLCSENGRDTKFIAINTIDTDSYRPNIWDLCKKGEFAIKYSCVE